MLMVKSCSLFASIDHIMRECLTKMCLLIYTSSEIAKYIWCFSTHVGLLKI